MNNHSHMLIEIVIVRRPSIIQSPKRSLLNVLAFMIVQFNDIGLQVIHFAFINQIVRFFQRRSNSFSTSHIMRTLVAVLSEINSNIIVLRWRISNLYIFVGNNGGSIFACSYFVNTYWKVIFRCDVLLV